MDIPNWYSLLLLGLAAWRTFQLLAFDDILDRPRRYVLRVGSEWQPGINPDSGRPYPVPDDYRLSLGIFVTCPYCAGFWIGIVWLVLWQIWPHATLVAAAFFVLNAIVVAGHKLLAKDEDR